MLKENNYEQKALTELKQLINLIEGYISPQMQVIQVIFAQVYPSNTNVDLNKNPNDTELYKEIVERCDIFNNFTGNVNHAITILEECVKPESKDHTIKVSNTKKLQYFVE
jgi:hypothetical protein